MIGELRLEKGVQVSGRQSFDHCHDGVVVFLHYLIDDIEGNVVFLGKNSQDGGSNTKEVETVS